MPLESVYSNQYPKNALGSNATVIVDDGERGMDAGLTEYRRARSLSAYHRLRQSVSYNNNVNHKHNGWRNSVSYPASFAPTQFPISPPLEAQSETSMPGATLNQHWFSNADMSVGSFPVLPQDVSVYGRPQPVKPEPHMGSRSPSIHSNGVAVSIDSDNSIASSNLSLTSESIVKDEQLQILQWDEPVSPEKSLESSPVFPKVNGFMVSEDTSDIPQMSLEQERRNIVGSRHTPSAFQPASVARKRKHRNSSIVNIDQIQQPRPLQIVQEDGLGGAIPSEDFVCPPRGARRKGPLTIVGRANAGLRRKNKDTCVQCRLNKRKVCFITDCLIEYYSYLF